MFGDSAIIILHTIKRKGTSRIATQVQKNNFVSLSIFDIYMYLVQSNYICWNLEFLVFPMSQVLWYNAFRPGQIFSNTGGWSLALFLSKDSL